MADEALLKDIQRRMDGAIEALRKEFGGLRTGRASASLLEPVVVNAYGSNMPLLKGQATYKYHVYWVELLDMDATKLVNFIRSVATGNSFTFTIGDGDYFYAVASLSASKTLKPSTSY